MLNIGQVVYDTTNERVLIFAGLEILQNQKSGECHGKPNFILKDGSTIDFGESEKGDFKYTNLIKDGKSVVGSFVPKLSLGGRYFGIIDINKLEKEHLEIAKAAIEEVEALIEKHKLTAVDYEFNGKSYKRYHIGEPKEYKPKLLSAL